MFPLLASALEAGPHINITTDLTKWNMGPEPGLLEQQNNKVKPKPLLSLKKDWESLGPILSCNCRHLEVWTAQKLGSKEQGCSPMYSSI